MADKIEAIARRVVTWETEQVSIKNTQKNVELGGNTDTGTMLQAEVVKRTETQAEKARVIKNDITAVEKDKGLELNPPNGRLARRSGAGSIPLRYRCKLSGTGGV